MGSFGCVVTMTHWPYRSHWPCMAAMSIKSLAFSEYLPTPYFFPTLNCRPDEMLSGLMKPYDLDSFCDAWSTAPIFHGESSKDGSVDAWLKDIEQGCKERDVPGKLWHAVAQRKMGRHASDRLYEVRKVMMFVTRGQFTWDWPKLKQAMRHMNCEPCLNTTLSADQPCR